MTFAKKRRQHTAKPPASARYADASDYLSPPSSSVISTSSSSSLSQKFTHSHPQLSFTAHRLQDTPERTIVPPALRPSYKDFPHPTRPRRGRQERASALSPTLHRSVRRFARAVGTPTIVEPAGFRDFRGWLARLSSREARPVWDFLVVAIAREVGCDAVAIHAVKEDVVRDIVKCVVIPRPDESAKLVSTNAGRQASRPRSGTTLILLLDQQVERLAPRLPQLVATGVELPTPQHDDSPLPEVLCRGATGATPPMPVAPLSGYTKPLRTHAGQLPSVADILGERDRRPRASLPSFRELDSSLRKQGH